MQRIAVERSSANRPAFLHAGPGAGAGRLLLGGENATAGNWNEARYRLALAGDDILLAGLDLADAAGKSLVSLAQGYRLAHIETIGSIIDRM